MTPRLSSPPRPPSNFHPVWTRWNWRPGSSWPMRYSTSMKRSPKARHARAFMNPIDHYLRTLTRRQLFQRESAWALVDSPWPRCSDKILSARTSASHCPLRAQGQKRNLFSFGRSPFAPRPLRLQARAAEAQRRAFVRRKCSRGQATRLHPFPPDLARDFEKIRSLTSGCGQSGIQISDLLPNLQTCADEMCFIRTLHTDQFNHAPPRCSCRQVSALAARA